MSNSVKSILVLMIIVTAAAVGQKTYFGTEKDGSGIRQLSPNETRVAMVEIAQSESLEEAEKNGDARKETGDIDSAASSELPSVRDQDSGVLIRTENLLELSRGLVETFSTDASGKSAFLLYQVVALCESAPKTQEELMESTRTRSDIAMMSGNGNGALQEIWERHEKFALNCEKIRTDITNDLNAYDLLKLSAEKGFPEALVQQATTRPEGFDRWPEEKKRQFRAEAGAGLMSAKQQCYISAFRHFASDTERKTLWDPPPGSEHQVPSIDEFAHQVAVLHIYENKFSDGKAIAEKIRNLQLPRVAKKLNLSEAEEKEAFSFGYEMYQDYCTR